jgi:hypothetical protein
MHPRADARRRPGFEPAADGAVRAARAGDPLIPAAMHQSGDDVLKHDPVRDPPAMTAQRVRRIELRALLTQQGGKLAPDRFQQA